MSGNGTAGSGIGDPAAGSSAASCPTVVMPTSRSSSAVSPRTTRLTSWARSSSASQVGHHGQRRHSPIRDGRASAVAPVAAAVATAVRSAKRASYSASVDRASGQWAARRSCHTTTSASRPMTPPRSAAGRSAGPAQPAARSMRAR